LPLPNRVYSKPESGCKRFFLLFCIFEEFFAKELSAISGQLSACLGKMARPSGMA
jgi:hypothetical protein